ncbi:MAG: hypothetical protein IRZ16_14305 [Myxococcaceae bacterium]|nr:hypothetical protein [Myxococcaceae bacterium]
MATVEEVEVAGRGSARKVSWGALFGGGVVALAVWALLYVLGIALGLSSVTPGESLRGPALFTGIWSIVTPLVALFVGGWVAARLAGLVDRTAGILHGAVLWGLTTLVGAFVLSTALGAVLGGAVSAGGEAISSVAGAMKGTGGSGEQVLGVETGDLLEPLNQRLREEGKPEVTEQQFGEAVQSAVGDSIREGRLDAETFESALAENTGLSREDVREVASSIEQRLNREINRVRSEAIAAAGDVAKAMWGVFFAMLLGLVSAVLGAAAGVAGVRRHERKIVRRERLATTTD